MRFMKKTLIAVVLLSFSSAYAANPVLQNDVETDCLLIADMAEKIALEREIGITRLNQRANIEKRTFITPDEKQLLYLLVNALYGHKYEGSKQYKFAGRKVELICLEEPGFFYNADPSRAAELEQRIGEFYGTEEPSDRLTDILKNVE